MQNSYTDNNNLETSLNLAAEVDNALLAENSKLKQDLQNLSHKNVNLAQNTESKNKNEIIFDEEIEKLQNENEIMLTRYNESIKKISRKSRGK